MNNKLINLENVDLGIFFLPTKNKQINFENNIFLSLT